MVDSVVLVELRDAADRPRKDGLIAEADCSFDRDWSESERDRLPLGICMVIWFVLSAAIWSCIVGLGVFVFS